MEDCEDDMFYSPDRIEKKNGEDGFTYINSEEEKIKLEQMRTMVTSKDPDSKGADDLTLLRFLRARDLDLKKASTMFLKHLSWRREFVPNGFISPSEVTSHIVSGESYLQGTDKEGCPIIIMFAGKHFPSRERFEEFKRFVVYMLDKACSRIPEGQSKFTVIMDLQGLTYACVDTRAAIAIFSILQDNYPERLKRAFVVNVPYIGMVAWKIVYPFVDQITRKKILFLDNKTTKDTLLGAIEQSQLLQIYGGQLKLVPIEEA